MVNSEFTSRAGERTDTHFTREEVEQIMGAHSDMALPPERSFGARIRDMFTRLTQSDDANMEPPAFFKYKMFGMPETELGDPFTFKDDYEGQTDSVSLKAGVKSIVGRKQQQGPLELVQVNARKADSGGYEISGDTHDFGLKRGDNITPRENAIHCMKIAVEIAEASEQGKYFDYESVRERLLTQGYVEDSISAGSYHKSIKALHKRLGKQREAEEAYDREEGPG